MKRLLVYSHDTYGLGNIRRMLAVCNYMIDAIPNLSIMLISGSPMVHNFRIKPGIDYIKLPCLTRTAADGYAPKTVGSSLCETVRLRSELILRTAQSFKPELILVDKKPYGVEHELRRTLDYARTELPDTKTALLLRDVLDNAEATRNVWRKNGYHEAIRRYYDRVLVVGVPGIFDPVKEYGFPPAVAQKLSFCGYIKHDAEQGRRATLRQELRLKTDKLVLVTVGGGEDGYHLLEQYLLGLNQRSAAPSFDSVVVCGPEMAPSQRAQLGHIAARSPLVQMREFVDDMLGYMDAADGVVSMGGYNTLCELLSLGKPSVVVPRVKPVEEQWIRAQRMANLGLFRVLHPDSLTPASLNRTINEILSLGGDGQRASLHLDLGALPRIASYIGALLNKIKPTMAVPSFQEYCSL